MSNDPRLLLFGCLAALTAFSSVPAFASPARIEGSGISIEAENAWIEILISPAFQPHVEVSPEFSKEAFHISTHNDLTTIMVLRRPEQTEVGSLRVFLTPLQNLQFQGNNSDLVVVERQPGPDDPSVAAEPDRDDRESTRISPCVGLRTFILFGGTATLSGSTCLTLTATETQLSAEGTSGPLSIDVTGGETVVRNHRGSMELTGRKFSESVVVDQQGTLALAVEEGKVTIEGGSGPVKCTFKDLLADIIDRQGSIELTGSDSVLSLKTNSGDFNFEGTQDIVQISSCEGHLRAALVGGELNISHWSGRIDVQRSEDAALNIDDLDGDLAFLFANSTGVVRGVKGHTRGILSDSKLTFKDLKSIEITATASDTSIVNVPRIVLLDVVSGRLRYESAKIAGQPRISLSDGALAEVLLPQPCIVRGVGPGAVDMGSFDVSGCEIRLPGQPWGKKRRKTPPPIRFEVELRESCSAFVSGF